MMTAPSTLTLVLSATTTTAAAAATAVTAWENVLGDRPYH